MASQARLSYQLSIFSPLGLEASHNSDVVSWSPAAGLASGQRQTVSLTGLTNNTVTVPTGAKFLAILLGSAVSITLKGNAADVGVSLTPATLPLGIDAILPVSAPTIVLYNGNAAAQSVDLLWA